ncbi:MAG: ParB/RepB/Spo0J family partition protein [Oscillospiraceae bacterium]|nr:ParB/RepB/Spo0J family partition protein [Oscillospiraceae bacterium]
MIFQRLVPEKTDSEEKGVINKVVELEVTKILPNPAQPRIIFDDYELSQLAVSIQQNGILQPLTVRAITEDESDLSSGTTGATIQPHEQKYELIAGERRLRAARLAGWGSVPCIIMETSGENSALLAIMENIQRSDLNYIEEAFAISRLIEYLGITQEEAAVKLGIAQSTVANKLRLLRLTDDEKSAVLRYRLNERQARALLRLPGGLRLQAVERISMQGLNSAATDRFIEEMLKPKKPSHTKKTFIIKQTALYINTFNHTIESMKKAGIACEAKKKKTDGFMEYVVRIPLK